MKYSDKEILEIFKEQHRLCSSLDPEADPSANIVSNMTIRDWRSANDLINWKKLGQYLNQEFRINITSSDWYNVLEPAKIKKLHGVCKLISEHATKIEMKPIKLFKQECLKASVFLTLKKNLENKGVDVSDLKPSSSIDEYIDKYFSQMLEEITLTESQSISTIKVKRRKKGFFNAINIFDKDSHQLYTNENFTFRELTEKIIEQAKT